MLLALATSVFLTPSLSRVGKAYVRVSHQGPPMIVEVLVRTKGKVADDWEYLSAKTFPRVIRTNKEGRRVTVQLPKSLKQFVQICAISGEQELQKGSSYGFQFRLESCANLPKPKA
jgi:hypothetical protein